MHLQVITQRKIIHKNSKNNQFSFLIQLSLSDFENLYGDCQLFLEK